MLRQHGLRNALLDANVVLRFLTGEPPEQAERARSLFDAAAVGAVGLFLPTVILVEAGFLPHRVLRLERPRVATLLASLGNTLGPVLEHREVVQRTLELFEGSAIPLADAFLAACALIRGGSAAGFGGATAVSFDRHFDLVAGLRRIEDVSAVT